MARRGLGGSHARVAAMVGAACVAVVVVLSVGLLNARTGVVGPIERRSEATGTPQPSAAASPSPAPSALVPATSAPSTVPFPTSIQLSAPARQVVWALVGSRLLFRSTDHGENWTQRPLPTGAPILELAFVNDREGFVMSAVSAGPPCTIQSVELWHTSDSGSTYDRRPATGIADAQCKATLSFLDAQRGFISTWSPNSAPLIYRTSDGGRSWSASQPLPDPPGFTTQPAASTVRVGPGPIRAFGTTLLLQASGNVLSGPLHWVYRSLDGGATWSHLATVPRPVPIGFVSAARWIQPSAPGHSQETTDGGATWHTYQANYGQAAPFPPVVTFADTEVGYAVGSRGGLQRTLDGGSTWISLTPPGLR